MATRVALSIALLFASLQLIAQMSGRIGLNFPPIRTGSPELLMEVDLSERLGLILNAGITRTDDRCCTKIGDGVIDYRLIGGYVKAGAIYHPWRKESRFAPLVQLHYLASWHHEQATKYVIEPWVDPREWHIEDRTLNALAHGVGIILGSDIRIHQRIGIRTGLQYTYAYRKRFIGSRTQTYQPGMGRWFQPTQLIAALWIRIGQ